MQPLLIVFNILLVVDAFALIVAVLMQQGNTQGLGTIAGGAETFFGKNKARSFEGKLETLTKVAATVFIVLAIATSAISARINTTASAGNDTYAPSVEPELVEDDAGETDGSLEMEVNDVVPDADADGDTTETAPPEAE